ncbi:MAG: plasma-membrane proton-efflux P-type ATPase [Colwellia sp.]|nr:plasma-membrane proton-efflux P-type ATPase [Colwellia sp.]
MKIKSTDDYLNQSISDSLDDFNVQLDCGLSKSEAKIRLERFGPNKITEKEESILHRILRRFWGPIPWMIEAAALLSAFVKHWEDFVIITIMLLVNVTIDFLQEHKALNALKVLKSHLNLEVRVLRDGHYSLLPAQDLVPGDIIRIRIGDVIPADVKLLSGGFLSIDESSLTGESLPVTKHKGELAYSNTVIKQGEMLALIVNTASNTRFNAVVALVAKASLSERSHFQQMVMKIGNFLIILTLSMVLLIIIAGIIRQEPLFEIARFALVLTVAAIPVALPAVLSVTMAVGAVNLAKKKAIVSRLTAIEELAGVDVFCSDKTGTLTKNEMQVAESIIFNSYTEQELFLYAVLASRHENHDPIEIPLFQYIDAKYPYSNWQKWQQLQFNPFDPVKKFTCAIVSLANEKLTIYKGAPQILLKMAELSDKEHVAITKCIELFATKGYRSLAVAIEKEKDKIELIGLIPLIDPEREDSAQVIKSMIEHGVTVKMITGDNAAIASEIGQRLGFKKGVICSKELSSKVGTQLLTTIESVDIFAEVLPEDKYLIVEELQKAGHLVGMTGDGVNDAPALKKADCGFAVSNATDAARASADIILTSPGLLVINHAIEQARITFERMKSYATFRVAETIRIVLFMTLSILIFNFYPITTVMIILLALLNDIPILAIAYDNTKVSSRPVIWKMHTLLTVSTVLGLAGVLSSFILFFWLQKQGFAEETIQSLIFLKLIIAGHSTLYITRADGWFCQKPYPSPLLLIATFGTEILGTLIAVYGLFITPIGWEFALYIWLYAFVWFLINDAIKMMTYRVINNLPENNNT